MSRETIYSALWDRLAKIPGIVTLDRRLVHWADVPASEQPALFMTCGGQSRAQTRGLPPHRTLRASLYLYVHGAADPKAAPSIQLNDLLDAIDDALDPEPGAEVQTLGGLVSHCWISGEIETDEGVLGDQALAIIPIEILIP